MLRIHSLNEETKTINVSYFSSLNDIRNLYTKINDFRQQREKIIREKDNIASQITFWNKKINTVKDKIKDKLKFDSNFLMNFAKLVSKFNEK